jgi:uncharacterized protein (DUF2236 family)
MPSTRSSLVDRAADGLRGELVKRVRAVFNDTDNGQQPVPISDNGLFPKDSPIRMVHADLVGMMVGGVRSLLLQMLHPHALQGVLDHSNFRHDMHGRLRRTARFMALTTFGDRAQAEGAASAVNRIHTRIKGTLPDGTPYSAQDPATLAWVHLAGAQSFLAGYKRYARPEMPFAEQDEYYRQFAVVGRMLGADPVPVTVREAETLFRDMRRQLKGSPEAREIARLVLTERPGGTPAAVQQILAAEAVAMLPPFARAMLSLPNPGISSVANRAATLAMGKTLRWAFGQE